MPTGRPVTWFIGVGGRGARAAGLQSLFDFSELSIMGISQVAGTPAELLMRRIRQTTDALDRRYDPIVLVIIDSPASPIAWRSAVRKALPDLPVVNMSARASGRGRKSARHACAAMSIMSWPFCLSSPLPCSALGGPDDLCRTPADRKRSGKLLAARARGAAFPSRDRDTSGPATCLLLPGSRSTEITAAADFRRDRGGCLPSAIPAS